VRSHTSVFSTTPLLMGHLSIRLFEVLLMAGTHDLNDIWHCGIVLTLACALVFYFRNNTFNYQACIKPQRSL